MNSTYYTSNCIYAQQNSCLQRVLSLSLISTFATRPIEASNLAKRLAHSYDLKYNHNSTTQNPFKPLCISMSMSSKVNFKSVWCRFWMILVLYGRPLDPWGPPHDGHPSFGNGDGLLLHGLRRGHKAGERVMTPLIETKCYMCIPIYIIILYPYQIYSNSRSWGCLGKACSSSFGASWIATRSFSSILSNSSMQTSRWKMMQLLDIEWLNLHCFGKSQFLDGTIPIFDV